MRILVVDDETFIHDIVGEYAKLYGHSCDFASTGTQAVELVKNNEYDSIIMDVMMPDLDGFNTTRRIKKMKNVPILMLSARHSEEDKLLGFEMGVDDYMTKPFSVKELMARLNVITSRSEKSTGQTILRFGRLVIDTMGRFIEVNGQRENLSVKEYDLLLYLVKHEKQVLSRETLLDAIWSIDFVGDVRTVDAHIKILRKNLKECRSYIKTVRGMGYLFEVDN